MAKASFEGSATDIRWDMFWLVKVVMGHERRDGILPYTGWDGVELELERPEFYSSA